MDVHSRGSGELNALLRREHGHLLRQPCIAPLFGLSPSQGREVALWMLKHTCFNVRRCWRTASPPRRCCAS